MTILYINQMCWTHEPNSVKENTKLKTCKLICNYTIICLPKHVLNLHHARKLTQLSWRHLWIVITVQGEQLIDAYSDIISTLYYWSKIKLVRWLMRKWWRIQKLSSYFCTRSNTRCCSGKSYNEYGKDLILSSHSSNKNIAFHSWNGYLVTS